MENYVFNKQKWWISQNQFTASYSKTVSDVENTIPSIRSWAFAFNSNNTFNLNKKKGISAELSFNYTTPSVSGSYLVSRIYYLDLGVKFPLINNKLKVAINALDVFRTNKYTSRQVVNGIRQENFDYPDSQKIRISLAWNFGKSLTLEERDQSNEEEKRRAN